MDSREKKDIGWLTLLAVAAHIPIYMGRLAVDTCVQMEMARNFMKTGDFTIEYSQSTHFSPLLSAIYVPFTATLGYNPMAIHTYEMLALALLLFAAYRAGSLYGRKTAVITALLVIFDPVMYGSMAAGLSEPLVSALLLLSFYYLVRATEDSSWLPAAGFISALIYLIKASTGYLIIAAAFVGFAWRFYYDRWKVLKNKGYLLGALVFLVVVFIWAVRNFILIGTPWTSAETTEIFNSFMAEPPAVILTAYSRYLILHLGYMALITLPALLLLPGRGIAGVREMLSIARRQERYSVLLVFVGGIWVMGALSAAAISTEVPTSAGLPHLRYVAVADPVLFIISALVFQKYGASDGRNAKRKFQFRDIEVPGRAVAAAGLLLLLCVPNLYIYMEDGSLQRIADYLDDNGVEVAWSDHAYIFRYNTRSSVDFRAVYELDMVPDGSTLVISSVWMAEMEKDNHELATHLMAAAVPMYGYYIILDYRAP